MLTLELVALGHEPNADGCSALKCRCILQGMSRHNMIAEGLMCRWGSISGRFAAYTHGHVAFTDAEALTDTMATPSRVDAC